ncbi:MAG: SMP-30/gluconolaconase/LRE protein [Mucilaginibacter sp.]|nr:SMP-30/gluconolaconase/LRE protein [Mucilaginibacter sp.]
MNTLFFNTRSNWRLQPFVFLICAILFIHNPPVIAQGRPAIAFTIKEKDLMPEGITYDSNTNSFFIGSLYKHKILRITTAGKINEFIRPDAFGLGQVVGMKVFGPANELWVCSNIPGKQSFIHVFDVLSGKLVRKFTVNGKKHFFNDLYITTKGDVYITDSASGGIYRISRGKESAEVYIPSGTFAYPNGITSTQDGKNIIVATGSEKGLVSIDLATKNQTPLSCRYLIYGVDGLYHYKNTLIGIQNSTFPESVQQFVLSGDGKKITSVKMLAGPSSSFNIPTTGVIVGNNFYFIANTQLDQFTENDNKVHQRSTLKNVLIMRVFVPDL